jgi:hypothetical protein
MPAHSHGRSGARHADRIRVATEDDDGDRLGARLARAAGRRGSADARRERRMEVRTDRAEHAAVGVGRQHVDVRQERPALAGSRRVQVRVDARPRKRAVAQVPGDREDPLGAAVPALRTGLGHGPDPEPDPRPRKGRRRSIGEHDRALRFRGGRPGGDDRRGRRCDGQRLRAERACRDDPHEQDDGHRHADEAQDPPSGRSGVGGGGLDDHRVPVVRAGTPAG